METRILVVDESGAKGLAKTLGPDENEIGVMAGIVCTISEMDYLNKEMGEIIKSFKSEDISKFHITDLTSVNQEKLRHVTFELIKTMNIKWFYDAIFSHGFHKSEYDKHRCVRPDPNKSLHSQLFCNMFMMGLFITKEQIHGTDINLIVKTDNIDRGVINKIQKDLSFCVDVLTGKKLRFIKNRPANCNIPDLELIIDCSFNKHKTPYFNKIIYDICCELTPITVLADVLTNSTLHYLKEYANLGGEQLNNKKAISKHPLVDLVFPINEGDRISEIDVLYRK